MRTWLGVLCAALAIAGAGRAPAAERSPPVEVAPIVLAAPDLPELAADAARLIGILVRDNWIAASAGAAPSPDLAACWALEAPDDCAAAALARSGAGPAAVAVFVDHPGWRSAAVRVRCIGSDAARASEVRVHLPDALLDAGPIADHERGRMTACLGGALRGALRD